MLARFGVALAIFAATSAGLFAQVDGTIQGTVIDESAAAMPGVGVTAVEEATGRRYLATTDGSGKFILISVAAGTYRIEAALQGFTSVATTGVEVLVGQNLNLPNMVLRVATLQESVTVTGTAPLIDTQSRQVGTNLDRRQLEVMPLQGRNWMELSLLAKGITANDADNTPGARDRYFNLNVDGQQITQNRVTATIAQPRFSREAIAEFQIITNQFDVSQGRSLGAQVQAISRAGTNTTTALSLAYFRDDSLNAADPIVKSVVPYTESTSRRIPRRPDPKGQAALFLHLRNTRASPDHHSNAATASESGVPVGVRCRASSRNGSCRFEPVGPKSPDGAGLILGWRMAVLSSTAITLTRVEAADGTSTPGTSSRRGQTC